MATEGQIEAKQNKFDEFYTLYADIENEMNAYLEYDPDVFKGKTILLPCDDPDWSNFTKYFAKNFDNFGLKKLISTSYAPNSKPRDIPYQTPLFELNDEKYSAEKTRSNGKIFTLSEDVSGDNRVDIDDLQWSYLHGDGDFSSAEVTRLRDEADFIITNPPFSLFREFLNWVTEGEKRFAIIGNINAITYRESFARIKRNQMWLGSTNFNKGMYFAVPDNFTYKDSYKFERERNGKKVNRVPAVCWFSNIEHGKRHQRLPLMTQAENLKFTKVSVIQEHGYQRYDNYDAIEVPVTKAIPSDFKGAMGVPITFLDKYNPEQFEILGLGASAGYDPEIVGLPFLGIKDARPLVQGTNTYARIFIRHKEHQSEN